MTPDNWNEAQRRNAWNDWNALANRNDLNGLNFLNDLNAHKKSGWDALHVWRGCNPWDGLNDLAIV
jgi:hypothetical protein